MEGMTFARIPAGNERHDAGLQVLGRGKTSVFKGPFIDN